jgi:hypothetical protein
MKERQANTEDDLTKEFQRQDAAKAEKRTIGQLNQELGVSSWSLKRWSKRHSGGVHSGKATPGAGESCRPWSLKTRSCGVNWRPQADNETS